jgi:hypothetical protein
MSVPPKTPPELDAAMRIVLAYKPKKAKVKAAKKRKMATKKKTSS